MSMLLRRMGRGGLTVRGFRSCFCVRCAGATARPREVAEQALAHALPDKVEAAYRRGRAVRARGRNSRPAVVQGFCVRRAPTDHSECRSPRSLQRNPALAP